MPGLKAEALGTVAADDPWPIVEVLGDGRIADASAGFAALVAQPRETLRGTLFLDLVVAEDRAEGRRSLAAVESVVLRFAAAASGPCQHSRGIHGRQWK